MKLVWVVRVPGAGSVVFDSFEPAWFDWKSHEGRRWLYPRLMRRSRFLGLKEHAGW